MLARAKQIDRLDTHGRDFIARSPLVISGSMQTERGVDVSPRGDAPGFVRVLDEQHLAIPDRPGNNRLDTFENPLANPAVGLFVVVPGIEEALRVNGTARLTRTEWLPRRMAVIVEQARPPGLTADEADARIEADYRTNLAGSCTRPYHDQRGRGRP